MRCADQVLTDERWLDAIASLIVQRPLDAWDDETLGRFETALAELCAQYKRWIKIIAQRARNPKAGARFVSVTLTLPGGEESSLFLVANEKAKAMASAVLAVALKDTNNDRALVSTVLAQALLDLQNGNAVEWVKESNKSGKQEAG